MRKTGMAFVTMLGLLTGCADHASFTNAAIPAPAWIPIVVFLDVGMNDGKDVTAFYNVACKTLGGAYTPTGGGVCK